MDAQVVAAVRELLARAPGVGVNAMVKHIRGEWPELAGRVNAKVVREAKAVLAAEAAAVEGEKGGGGAAAGGGRESRGAPGRPRHAAAPAVNPGFAPSHGRPLDEAALRQLVNADSDRIIGAMPHSVAHASTSPTNHHIKCIKTIASHQYTSFA